MSLPERDRRELSALLDSAAADQLTSSERNQLNALLRASGEAQKIYLDYFSMHAALAFYYSIEPTATLADERFRDAGDRLECASSDASVARSNEPSAPTVGAGDAAPQRFTPILGFLSAIGNLLQHSPRTMMLILAGALAGYFLVMLALIPLSRFNDSARLARQAAAAAEDQQPAPGTTIGRLTASRALRRPGPGPNDAQDNALRIGQRYELDSGQAQLTLAGGVRLAIEGPAAWRVDSAEQLWFEMGRLAAHVSPQAVGYRVVTPRVEVVDLGTEFALSVAADGQTDIYVQRGAIEINPTASAQPDRQQPTRLTAGNSARVTAVEFTASIPSDGAAFARVLEAVARPAPLATTGVTQIFLGNLFDDRPRTSLAEAMRSDTFHAEADFNDLGVDRVLYGGSPLKEIAPGVQIDLTNLGWQGGYIHNVCNDAWSNRASNIDELGRGAALRMDGKPLSMWEAKIDDGIGMVPNALITFQLDDIRAAGQLDGQRLEFVCDRAGLNDDCLRLEIADLAPTVHMVVLVSTVESVCTAVVDGKPATVEKHADHWSVVSPIGEPLRADGRYASFHVPLERDAKYLTLISTAAGDGGSWDASAWIGARLEVHP